MNLKSIISSIPHKPGVYQYFNTDGTILYVGKAKDLKKEYHLILLKVMKMVKQLSW